ncbi:DUF3558 domain-containing protein [Streptomyces sp. NPDC050418]|uniref:DUF3558 domain-containing protein n=1 Tax=Streptomyces sp. NPDC050418 TaxID=3365612 RepID=UPI00379C34FE
MRHRRSHKGYLAGAAALAAVLLTGCTSDGGGAGADDDKPEGFATSPAEAAPGKYDTLPEPCNAVGRDTLDAMLPGIKDLADERREKAYAGAATVTFDTDRRAGCRWTVESADATHRLHVDFERVVSYDPAVSDDELATDLFLDLKIAADLPEPAEEGSDEEPSGDASESASEDPSDDAGDADAEDGKSGDKDPSASASSTPPEGLEPRVLDDLADEAYLDDELSAADSAARRRMVTVVFRTSNVLVTIEYSAQPASVRETPDSKELQDRARVLGGRLAEQFTE